MLITTVTPATTLAQKELILWVRSVSIAPMDAKVVRAQPVWNVLMETMCMRISVMRIVMMLARGIQA